MLSACLVADTDSDWVLTGRPAYYVKGQTWASQFKGETAMNFQVPIQAMFLSPDRQKCCRSQLSPPPTNDHLDLDDSDFWEEEHTERVVAGANIRSWNDLREEVKKDLQKGGRLYHYCTSTST